MPGGSTNNYANRVADIVDKDMGVAEVKSGNGRLSTNQKKLQDDIANEREVTPVGKNADAAGLTPGQSVRFSAYEVVRKDNQP